MVYMYENFTSFPPLPPAISDIAAPSQQFIVRGSTSHLNCSYPGATILWYEAAAQGGGLTSAWFFPATLEHEGEYQCEVFLDQSGASVRVTVFLHIIGEGVRV